MKTMRDKNHQMVDLLSERIADAHKFIKKSKKKFKEIYKNVQQDPCRKKLTSFNNNRKNE